MVAVPEPLGNMMPLEPGPVATAIGAALAEANDAAGDRPTSGGTLLRGSQALTCARKIGFEAIKYPADVPLTPETLLVFRAGHLWHDDIIQPALIKEFGAEVEVPATWMPHLSLSCWLDAVYEADRARIERFTKVAVEIKSQASYGFDLAAGLKRRIGEYAGPKPEHIAQSALGALAPDVAADGMHIIYASKEKGSLAEWIFGVDDPLPHLGGVSARDIAEAELKRMAGIIGRLEAGELPRPVVPGYGLVVNPPDRDSKGQPWQCRYCAYQPTCAALPADVVPLSSLKKHTEQGA